MEFITFKEAFELLNDPYSCFELETCKKHMLLPPKYISNVQKGVCEQLDSEKKRFSDSLEGVIMAYSSLKLFQHHGFIMGSAPFIHFDVQADFILFRPKVSSCVKVTVNKKGKDHIGGVVHGVFNFTIPQSTLQGLNVELGQEIVCEVTKIYSTTEVISMLGKVASDRIIAKTSKKKRKADHLEDLEIPADSETADHFQEQVTPRKKKKKKDKVKDDTDESVTETFTKSKKHKKLKHKEHTDTIEIKDEIDHLDSTFSNTTEDLGSVLSGHLGTTPISAVNSVKTTSHKKKKKHKSKDLC